MKRKSAYLIVSVLIALLAALARPGQARATAARAFVEAPCPMALPAGLVEGQDVRCGYVTVPEDHARPADRTIQLAVVIFDGGSSHNPRLPLPLHLLSCQTTTSAHNCCATPISRIFDAMGRTWYTLLPGSRQREPGMM